jgi:Reverse transcriptase (RNA-dependent DNA polymerase)
MGRRGLRQSPRPASAPERWRPGRQPGNQQWRHFHQRDRHSTRPSPATPAAELEPVPFYSEALRDATPAEEALAFPWRMAKHSQVWREAGASPADLSIVTEGLRLPFTRPPPPFHQGVSLQASTPQEWAWLVPKAQEMICQGVWRRARCRRYVSRAHLVPKGDKWRLVFDGRAINRFLQDRRCRYETPRRLCTLLQRNDYCLSLDLDAGFHHVPIHPSCRQYLTVEIAGLGCFEFCALPFGLNVSPYFFTKLMRTFVRCVRAPLAGEVPDLGQPPCHGAYMPPYRRKPGTLAGLALRFGGLMRRGIRMLPYMDDFLFAFRTRAEALQGREYISEVLALLGLSRNPSKGEWEPTQRLKHLGLGIDTSLGLFFVTPDRLSKLSTFAKDLLLQACNDASQGLLPKRRVAAFAGLAQSLSLALPLARFKLRSLHDMCSSIVGWSGCVRLTPQARRDLQWFADLLPRYNGRPIWRSPHSALLHCDASKLAWGAVLNISVPARGFWTPHERRQHITFLELRAVRLAVENWAEQLRGRYVLLREDNQAVVSILTTMVSKSPAMMAELRRLWRQLDLHDITLSARYIRSGDNWWADSLSRDQDKGDWQLRRCWFERLDRMWGAHTVDRFATRANALLPRFNSAWWDSKSEGLDAFAQSNWAQENNWCHPPADDRVLDRLAQLLDETGAAATVLVPHWPAQPWYQRLQQLATQAYRLPAERGLFTHGSRTACTTAAPPPWSVIAFRLPGRPKPSGNL